MRAQSVALAAPLSAEDCCAQSMPDASPLKWHLAHTSWFFETFILERFEADFRPCHPAFRMLFNSYYNGVGSKYPRPQRGLLTRPSLAEVHDYRREVDRRIGNLLALPRSPQQGAELAGLLQLGLQHEQQHQELMQTDLKHLLSANPLAPAAYDTRPVFAPAASRVAGLRGAVDRDRPCRPRLLFRQRNATPPPVHRAVCAGIAAGDQRRAAGLHRGRRLPRPGAVAVGRLGLGARRRPDAAALLAPRQRTAAWQEFTLCGLQPLDPQQPALHLSYFEADAYARWAGARLPTEAEWELAAADPGLAQLFGVAWQWTSSSYAPYPGYAPAAGAIGEYNGKFMVNQYVLRGSSCATPAGHARRSYRNFFPATARWQFSGIRLAKSGPA